MGNLCQLEPQSSQKVQPAARPLPSLITVHIAEVKTLETLREDSKHQPAPPVLPIPAKIIRKSTDSDCREAELVQELARFMKLTEGK
jgi:hypothetical protein